MYRYQACCCTWNEATRDSSTCTSIRIILLYSPVLHRPHKKLKSRFSGQIHDWKHLYLRFFLRTTFRDSAVTPASPLINQKVHHPAIESLVLSLQCGKAAAVFVSSGDRDFVAEVGNCGSRLLELLFLELWPSIFFAVLFQR